MRKSKSAKSKIQKVVDYLMEAGDQRPRDVIEHFKGKGITVYYSQVITAKRKAWPDKFAKPKRVARKPAKRSERNGVELSAIMLAAELIQKLGGVVSAKQAIAAVEKIRCLPD